MESIAVEISLSYQDQIPQLTVTFDGSKPGAQRTLAYFSKTLPTTRTRISPTQYRFEHLECVYTTLELLLSSQRYLTLTRETLAALEEHHLKLSLDYFTQIRQRPLPATWQPRDGFVRIQDKSNRDASSHSIERVRKGKNEDWILKQCAIEDRQEFEPAIAALVRALTNQHAPEMLSTYKKRRATGNVSRELRDFQSIETKVRDRVKHHMWTLEYSEDEEEALFNTLLNSGQFAVKATDLIDQGIVEAIRVQDLLQHDDAQSTNIGIDADERVVLVDFERYLWPMMCQNFGYSLDDNYLVGDRPVPVLQAGEQDAESIRNITFANPFKRMSLQQTSESIFLDMSGLDHDPRAQRRNIKLYLKFLLLPKTYFIQIAKAYIGSTEWQESFVRYLEKHQSNLRSICLGMPEFNLNQPEGLTFKDEILEDFRRIPEINLGDVQEQWNTLVALVGKPLPPRQTIREVIATPKPSQDDQENLAYCLKLKSYIEQHEWQLGWQRQSRRYFIIVKGQQKRVPTHVYRQYQRLLALLESEFDLAQEKQAIMSLASLANAQFLHFFRRADTRKFYQDCAADTLDFQGLDPNNIAAHTIQVY